MNDARPAARQQFPAVSYSTMPTSTMPIFTTPTFTTPLISALPGHSLAPVCSAAAIVILLLVHSANVGAADHWPQFRGPNATGVVQNTNLPDKWSAEDNVAWKQEIPGRGWSSPVIWGKQVFLTTVVNSGETEAAKKGLYFGGNRPKPPATDHDWQVLCLNLDDGKVAWQKNCPSRQAIDRYPRQEQLCLRNTHNRRQTCVRGFRWSGRFLSRYEW
jgi:hypothetical protein